MESTDKESTPETGKMLQMGVNRLTLHLGKSAVLCSQTTVVGIRDLCGVCLHACMCWKILYMYQNTCNILHLSHTCIKMKPNKIATGFIDVHFVLPGYTAMTVYNNTCIRATYFFCQIYLQYIYSQLQELRNRSTYIRRDFPRTWR